MSMNQQEFHWIALRVNAENLTYFDSFTVDYILQQKLKNPLEIKYYNECL